MHLIASRCWRRWRCMHPCTALWSRVIRSAPQKRLAITHQLPTDARDVSTCKAASKLVKRADVCGVMRGGTRPDGTVSVSPPPAPAMSIDSKSRVQLPHWAKNRRAQVMGPWRRPNLYPVAAAGLAHKGPRKQKFEAQNRSSGNSSRCLFS
jgi:hypothetical protein